MSHQNEGAMLAEFGKGVVQFEIQLRKCAWLRPRVTPGIPGAIVGADAREPLNTGLDKNPVERKISQPVLYYHGWSAAPSAAHMKAVATKVNQLAWGFRSFGNYAMQ